MRGDIEALHQLAKIATQGFADEETLTQAASIIRRATGASEAMVVYAENQDFLVCTDARAGAATDFTQTALWIVQRQIIELGGPVAFNLVGHRVEDFTNACSDEEREFLALSVPTSESASEMCILRGAPEHKGRATVLRFMESAAPALTMILERFLNAERGRRLGEQLRTLANAAQVLTRSEDVEAALRDLATATSASTGFEYIVNIDLYDATTGRFFLRILSEHRHTSKSLGQFWGASLNPDRPDPWNMEVMTTLKPSFRPDMQNDPVYPEHVRKYYARSLLRSAAAFPLLFQDEFLGTMSFVSFKPRTFPPEEVSLLQGFVTQAATALKALQMHNELQQYARDLKRSADEYIATTNLTGDLIARLDKHGNWTFLNDAACQFFGKPREELIGTDSRAFLHPDDLEPTAQGIRETRATKALATGFVNRQLTPMGTRVVEWNGYALFDEDGQYAGVQITGRDITERKEAEERIRESEEKFKNIFQGASDPIIYLDTSGTILDVNDKAVELFGGPREELLGTHFTEVGIFQPSDLPTLMTNFAGMLSGKKPTVEVCIEDRNGQERFLDCSASPLKGDGKDPHVVIVVARDITERKRAEEQLAKSRQMLENISQGITDTILLVSKDFEILWANNAVLRQTGCEMAQVLGNRCYKLTHHRETPCDGPIHPCPICEVKKTGKPATATHSHFDAEGREFSVEVSAYPIRDDKGEVVQFVHMSRDISERKQMEEEIRRRNQELRVFLDLSRTVASTIEFDDVLQKALNGVSELLPQADAVSLAIYNRDKDVLEIKAARGTNAKPMLKMVLKPGEGISGKALQLGKSVLYSSPAEVRAALADMTPANLRLLQQLPQSGSLFQSAICSPLIAEGRPLGSLLVATSAADAPFQPSDVALLEAAASHIAVALDKAQLHADTKLRAITDGLTGLYNHAHFYQRLAEEIERSKRYDRGFAVVIMDVDNFKQYNDSRGHQAGDVALRLIADCVRAGVRRSDLAFRYGGDEFAALLLNANSSRAQAVVNRINRRIAARLKEMDDPAAPWLGLSAGVASFPEDATTVDELVKMADAALYNAKRLAWARGMTEEGQAIQPPAPSPGFVHETQTRVLSTAASSLATVLQDLGACELAPGLDVRAIAAVGAASEIRDRYIHGHQERTALWAAALAEEMGLLPERVRNIRIAGLLHDLGKVTVNERILNKPGKLTEEEFAKVKQHASRGAAIIISEAEALQQLAPIVRHHHERFGGKGYPDGLAGEEIPIEARILAVADVFDAMTHERAYRKALSREEAIAELERSAGTQFDPAVVEAFLALVKRPGEEPPALARAASADRQLAAARAAGRTNG